MPVAEEQIPGHHHCVLSPTPVYLTKTEHKCRERNTRCRGSGMHQPVFGILFVIVGASLHNWREIGLSNLVFQIFCPHCQTPCRRVARARTRPRISSKDSLCFISPHFLYTCLSRLPIPISSPRPDTPREIHVGFSYEATSH